MEHKDRQLIDIREVTNFEQLGFAMDSITLFTKNETHGDCSKIQLKDTARLKLYEVGLDTLSGYRRIRYEVEIELESKE